MSACSCVCMFAEFVSTWYKQEALVSVSVPRALLSHDQMTRFCVAKTMPSSGFNLMLISTPWPWDMSFVAMTTASRVTVNEKSALDGCMKYFSLCLCIKLGTLPHLPNRRRLIPFLQHFLKVRFTPGWHYLITSCLRLLYCAIGIAWD